MFDWNDLRFLIAIGREGSTLAAAKSLHVSQPTVQRRIAVLEKRIGHKLVEQHPTGYRLTDLGRALFPQAEEVERSVAAFQRHVSAAGKELAGTLRVTCPEGVASRLLAPIITAFQEKHPALHVDLIMTDRRLDLTKGEADVALRMHEPGEPSLIARRIFDSSWAVYASHSYLKRYNRPQGFADLAQHAVVEFGGDIARTQAGRWLQKTAPLARVAASANSMLGVLASVKSGVGLAPLPIILGGPEEDIEAILAPIPELASGLYLVTHADLQHNPRVRAFCDFMAAEVARSRAHLTGVAGTRDRRSD